jgi:Flp pilus assembly protein TadD
VEDDASRHEARGLAQHDGADHHTDHGEHGDRNGHEASHAHAHDGREDLKVRPMHLDHEDPVAEAFFRHPDKPVIDVWEDGPIIHTMSRGSRRAMFTSIGIFAISMLGIGAYSAYHNLIMPAPVELAGSSPIEPTLPLAPEPAPIAQAQLAPSPVAPSPLAAASGTPGASITRGEDDSASTQAASTAGPAAVAQAPAAAPRATVQPAAPPERAVAVAAGTDSPASVATSGDHARPTYDELLAVGRSFSKRNRRTEAVEAFQRALIQSPEASTALSGLGYVYLNAAENRRAQEYAERAVEADASNAEGWIVLGAARELLGDKSGAMAAYRKCVEQGKGAYLLQCRQVVR